LLLLDPGVGPHEELHPLYPLEDNLRSDREFDLVRAAERPELELGSRDRAHIGRVPAIAQGIEDHLCGEPLAAFDHRYRQLEYVPLLLVIGHLRRADVAQVVGDILLCAAGDRVERAGAVAQTGADEVHRELLPAAVVARAEGTTYDIAVESPPRI